jgi:hypothetical protein
MSFRMSRGSLDGIARRRPEAATVPAHPEASDPGNFIVDPKNTKREAPHLPGTENFGSRAFRSGRWRRLCGTLPTEHPPQLYTLFVEGGEKFLTGAVGGGRFPQFGKLHHRLGPGIGITVIIGAETISVNAADAQPLILDFAPREIPGRFGRSSLAHEMPSVK